MGDLRYEAPYLRVRDAEDRQATLAALDDDEVIQALGAASRARDPLLANVLATEALNRMQRAVAIARHLGEGTLASDVEGRCTFANRAARAALALDARSMIGQPVVDLLRIKAPDGGSARGYDPISRVLATGGTLESDEWAFEDAQGRVFPVSFTCAPIEREGHTWGAVVTFRDITRQRAHESELGSANAFLQGVIDALPLSIAILDEDARIVAVNRSWRKFGKENELAWDDAGIGRDYAATSAAATGEDAEDAQAFARGIRDVLTGRERFFEREYPCHSPTERRWFLGRVTPLAWAGPPHAVVSHLDITKRRLAEIEIMEMLEAEDRFDP